MENNFKKTSICTIIKKEDLTEDKTDTILFNKILDEYETCFKPTLYLNKSDDEILFKIYNLSKKRNKNPAYKRIMNRVIKIIIDYNECYIKKIVHKFNPSRDVLLSESLMQESRMQIIKAMNKYDYTKDTAFITFAHYFLVSGISEEKRKETKSIQFDVEIRHKMNLVGKSSILLKQELNRDPTVFEIAERTNMTINEVDKMLCLCAGVESFDKYTVDDTNDSTKKEADYGSILYDKTKDTIEDTVCNSLLVDEIKALVDQLTNENDKKVIQLRFGLNEQDPMTLQQIADLLGYSKERIRQIESKALRKLRKLCRNNDLQLFL